MSLEISCECWNSAQSIFTIAGGSPNNAVGGGLNRPRLARSGRSQKEQRAERLAWQHQLRQIDLIDLRERKGGLILRHDALEEFQLEFTGLIASLPDVERDQS